MDLSGNVSVKKALNVVVGPGTLTLSGDLSLVVTKVPKPKSVSGILSLSGNVSLVRNKALQGTLSLSGTLSKVVRKALSGNLSLTSDLLAGRENKLNTSGELALSGDVQTAVGKAVSGSLNLSSALSLSITKNLEGSIALSGDILTKTPKMATSGELNLSGTLALAINKALSGDLILSGDLAYSRAKMLEGWLYLGGEPSIALSGDLTTCASHHKELEGAIELTGDVSCPGYVGGSLALSGNLGITVHRKVNLSGDLSLSGDVSKQTRHTVSLEGGLKFMRVLTAYTTPYTYENVSLINTAAVYDIKIEQGVSFRRFFRWMKSDGIPFTFDRITLEMVITTSKIDPGIIAYSPKDITITTAGMEPGVFRVDISSDVTSSFDFTRASYMIIAYWSAARVRLVEGEVILSRTLRKRLSQSVVGSVNVTGDITKNVPINLSSGLSLSGGISNELPVEVDGTLSLDGTVSTHVGKSLSGSIDLTGSTTKTTSIHPSGELSLSGTLEAEKHEH